LKFKGGNPGVRIGDRNVFREYVKRSRSNVRWKQHRDRKRQHDPGLQPCGGTIACWVIIIVASNSVGLAGHVIVEDHVTFGSALRHTSILPHRRVFNGERFRESGAGHHTLFIADGQPAIIRSLNKVGLERKGFTLSNSTG